MRIIGLVGQRRYSNVQIRLSYGELEMQIV